MPTPVPASAKSMRGLPSRSRGSKTKAASRAYSAWAVRSSSRRARPKRTPSLRTAASGLIGVSPGSPAGPGSSHSARRDQTSRPELRKALLDGWRRRASVVAGPQAQPPRARVSARARASSREGVGLSASSSSRRTATWARASAISRGPEGSGHPRARARPAADGAVKAPGRTKANSSSTSNIRADRGGGSRPSLRAVRAACATRTSGDRKRSRASGGLSRRTGPSPARAALGPGRTTRAGGRFTLQD